MVIAHNLGAINAQRQYNIVTNKKSKSSEKLASGYKINRSADDAAGLSISEKMRRQIRGLNQGSDNIGEGISLVQVADGALEEVTSCLQRINELSIKAYNETNQKEDQEYIQGEITQLVTEIERIADTTTFNELYVLKGNPKVEMVVGQDNAIDGYTYIDYKATIPDWLRVSPKLEKSNSDGITLENLDTTSNAMLQTRPGIYEYYGAPDSELDKIATSGSTKGEWSPTVEDNASAIIDFSGLTNVTTASELFDKLFDLLGTSIGVPCGTCTEYYGVSFTGSENGLEIKDGGTKIADVPAKSISYFNLSDWRPWVPADESTVFDKIRNMVKEHASNDQIPNSIKQNQVLDLAHTIASGLCKETVNKITITATGKEHFNRASKIVGSPYSLMIYDFRDTDKLSTQESADSLVQVTSSSWAKVPISMLPKGTLVEVEKPLIIQCSSNVDDELPIDLPLLDGFSLGIESYDISNYEEITKYSEKYSKALEDWKRNDCTYEYITTTIPAQPAGEEERYVTKLDFDRNGEITTKIVKEKVKVPATPEREITTKVLKENKPKPQPGPNDIYTEMQYAPSNVKRIADALSYVSMCRANLGATQNRLEHAYNNNRNNEENTTAAESQIRDTDMAKEAVAFSNLNILQQAGQAMLAQANQSNQGILSLLQ